MFYVPEGSWNYKLNTISVEVVDEFISAGFLRQVFLWSGYNIPEKAIFLFLQRKMLSGNLKL